MANKVKVYEIKDVRLTAYRSVPPKLLIEVDAIVPTPGFTDPELVEYIYVQPPPNGIYDFDFYATPPSGVTPQVLSLISVRHLMEPMPGGLRGVEVHASNNSQVALLSASSSPSTICVKGRLTDGGIECQAFESTTGELFTLMGDLNGYQNGDEVIVCGTIIDISICMQGTTIGVSWIGKEAPRAQKSSSAGR
jgi:hypothetical protein